MACAPTPCPPFDLPPPVDVEFHTVPDPAALPDWTTPDPAYCSAPYTYYSTQQSYTDTCPEDTDEQDHFTITVTVPPYAWNSTVDQSTANALALADAESQVDAIRILYPCVPSDDLISTEQEFALLTEDGRGISLS